MFRRDSGFQTQSVREADQLVGDLAVDPREPQPGPRARCRPRARTPRRPRASAQIGSSPQAAASPVSPCGRLDDAVRDASLAIEIDHNNAFALRTRVRPTAKSVD